MKSSVGASLCISFCSCFFFAYCFVRLYLAELLHYLCFCVTNSLEPLCSNGNIDIFSDNRVIASVILTLKSARFLQGMQTWVTPRFQAGRILFCFLLRLLAVPWVKAIKKYALFFISFFNTFMVFPVLRRRKARSEANALRTAVAVVVSTFVLFGIVESAFAQRLGKVQKRGAQKRVVEETPRIMPTNPSGHGVPPRPVELEGTPLYPPTPPVYVEAPRDFPGYPLYPIYPWTPAPPSPPNPPGGQPSNPEPGGGGGGNEPPPTDRVQTVFCSCDVSVYSTPHPGHLENCPRSPTNHYFTRIGYTSSVTLTTSQPDKSHSEVCSTGSVSGPSVMKGWRITDYPNCGDNSVTYEYLPYGNERCSN
jgi:hypothetical protein